MDNFLQDCPLELFSNSIHIGEKLGEGGNSAVYQCVFKKNEYAVKILNADIHMKKMKVQTYILLWKN